MIGCRASVGLSLLCALLFSAIAVQSASATAGTNITAFNCGSIVFGGANEFSDSHCDKYVGPGSGSYGHSVIGLAFIDATNVTTGEAKSTQVLEGSPFKVSTKIECTTLIMSKEGTVSNSEPSEKVHKLTGKGTLHYTGCTVVKPLKCTTKEIVAKIGSVETQEGLTGPKGEANAMGLEFKAEIGKPLTTITLEGAECSLKGAPFPVEGSVIATNGPGAAEAQTNKHSGATAVITPAMSSLVAGGRPATYSGTMTFTTTGPFPVTTTTVT
jgi:hypothetical protein